MLNGMRIIERPQPGEYPDYAITYIKWVPTDGLILKHLADNLESTRELILSLPEDRLDFRYAEGKWSIREILVHISDTERIFASRILIFARNVKKELPGFDQEEMVRNAHASRRATGDILDEYGTVRRATLSLVGSLQDEVLLQSGVANGYPVTVRALVYYLAGHEMHHIQVIRERYLG
jgi:uncharacterized damage-inducible protein DinB